MTRALRLAKRRDRLPTPITVPRLARPDPRVEPDWSRKCEVCGARPIMPITKMCGPCTTGEADTAGGNW